jgi:SAM-dependent MidA family methyltransferase
MSLLSPTMTSASTKLERKLIDRIKREGPITFRDFMHTALYDPELGYYNTERLKIGATGDYVTSSNFHPVFGAVLARAFVELWSGSTDTLTVVEFGAGTGRLACDVLTAMRDEHAAVFQRLGYVIIETSPAMRKRQRDTLAAFADRVSWSELEEIEREPITGLVFSNEFVDALPVHRVRFKNGAITEAYVTVVRDEPERLTLAWSEPSTKRLTNYIERMGVSLREDQIIEINLAAVDWLARIARGLRRGFLITIDYGDLAQFLWANDRSEGTVRSFHKHHLTESILESIGHQDITASVNFTALTEYGGDVGFTLLSYERQIAFLIRMGLIERIVSEHSAADSLDDLKDRLAVKNLFVPGGISDSFRVMIQRR